MQSSQFWARILTALVLSASLAHGQAPSAQQSAMPEDKPKENTTHISVDSPGLDPITGIPYYEEISEDWSSLQVGSSDLHPEPPVVTLPDDEEKFTRTLIALKWRPGDALDVYVVIPKGVKKAPAVLYLYNYTDDTNRFKNDGWCERATANGVVAIGFVSALSGQRFHDRPMKQWFVSELQESIGSTVHDVKFILDYLASRGDIDMDRIGMFGQGSGATIALLAAAAEPRLKAVDALDPWGDWPTWLAKTVIEKDDPEHAQHTAPEFLAKVAPLDPVQWLPRLQTPSVRIQQNMKDAATPSDSKDRIKAAAPKQADFKRFDSVEALMKAEGGGKLLAWIQDAVAKPLPSAKEKDSAVASGSAKAPDGKNAVQR